VLGNSHARFLGGWTRVTASDYPTTNFDLGLLGARVGFAGSLRSGKWTAAIMSVIQSAGLNGHDPHAYLKTSSVSRACMNVPRRDSVT